MGHIKLTSSWSLVTSDLTVPRSTLCCVGLLHVCVCVGSLGSVSCTSQHSPSSSRHRPDDGTPHSPDWRFGSCSLVEEAGTVVDFIVSGASESAIDDLVSSFLHQMNISRSELPHAWTSDFVNDVEVKAELNFEDQRKIVRQHYKMLGFALPVLSTNTSQSVSSGSTSAESSGYLSEDSSPPFSHGSALSPPYHEQVKAEDPFLPGTHEEGLLTSESNSCASSEQDPKDIQCFMDMVSSSAPHHLLSRHDSVEDALRSVLESQTALQ